MPTPFSASLANDRYAPKLGQNQGRLRIENLRLLDRDAETLWHLELENGVIQSLVKANQAPNYKGSCIDGRGFLLHPGFMNAHTHAPMSFLKGLGHGEQDIVENVFFPLEKSLKATDTEALSLPFLIETLRSGVTTIFDHYYFSEGVAAACQRLGLRGFIGETIADQGGAFPQLSSFDRACKIIDQWSFSDLVKPVLAPHASESVHPDTLKAIFTKAKSENLLCHMHLSQSKAEFELMQQRHQMSPVRFIESLGGLWDGQLLVHLLYVDEQDLNLLKKSGAYVCLCPASQILYEQLAPIHRFVEKDIPLLLGTDCSACNDTADLHSELRIAALLEKHQCRLNKQSSTRKDADWVNLLSKNPGQFVMSQVKTPLGALKVGYAADLVFFKESSEWEPLASDLSSRLVYSHPSPTHVMVAGQFVLWNREPCLISEQDALREFRACQTSIKKRLNR